MSKQEKLFDRFLTLPSDFTWDELVRLLSAFNFKELTKGKTAGSRRKFVNENGNLILLHKPHPSAIIKRYALKQVYEYLQQNGFINN
jgi:HicA toxin of bacterial toxin-antitoxin,